MDMDLVSEELEDMVATADAMEDMAAMADAMDMVDTATEGDTAATTKNCHLQCTCTDINY